MKTCIKCSVAKELSCYYKDPKSRDGFMYSCKVCHNDYQKKHYAKNKDSYKKVRKEYRESNKEAYSARHKKYREANKEELKTRQKEWASQNPDKVRLNSKKYRQRNSEKINHWAAKRRANKRKATPTWLTKDQEQQISYFYWLAKDLEAVTGEKYHVDHVIPLGGEEVCGLHVPWNLQVLPADINVRKGNQLEDSSLRH